MTLLTRTAGVRATGGPPAAGLVLIALATAAMALQTPSAAGTAWRAELAAGGGYDDDVLGRPGEDNSFPILANRFVQLAPSLAGSWAPGRWALTGGWNYVLNAYDSDEAGLYHDNVGRLGLAVRPADAIRLAVDGQAQWFHRSEFQDYDFRRREISPSIGWQVGPGWSLTAAWRRGRIEYPERTTRPVGGQAQLDRPDEWALTIGFDPDARWRLTGGIARLTADSNSERYEYTGIRLAVRAAAELGRGWSLDGELTRETRDYDRFGRLVNTPAGNRLVFGRDDDSWSVDLDLDRRLNDGMELFAGVSFLDYGSSLEDYAFDQARLRGGIVIHFGRSRGPTAGQGFVPPGVRGMARDPLEPVVSGGRVTFRCRAPEAGAVDLVGSFNGWEAGATPLVRASEAGLWEVSVPLEPGLYRYMFLVDSREWRTPEGALLYEDDGFGQRNGVIDVSSAVTDTPGGSPTSVIHPR